MLKKESFTVDTMKALLKLDDAPLLTQDDIKGLDGKTARKKIKDYLGAYMSSEIPEQDQYEF
ncbi:hypothetical protein GCM10023186_22320 [Hymenobacter koreensis]|uniref:Uncharacterized protein n=2 Tax=Hymenobacter koreensis TaxID=1084523 RepID=A0ABP8IZP1_9BACT